MIRPWGGKWGIPKIKGLGKVGAKLGPQFWGENG